jgi:hypothetical protein
MLKWRRRRTAAAAAAEKRPAKVQPGRSPAAALAGGRQHACWLMLRVGLRWLGGRQELRARRMRAAQGGEPASSKFSAGIKTTAGTTRRARALRCACAHQQQRPISIALSAQPCRSAAGERKRRGGTARRERGTASWALWRAAGGAPRPPRCC